MPASDYEALYSSARWRRIRAQHLAVSPTCVRCWRERGIVTVASEVHHRRKHQGDRRAFFVIGHHDLEALCKRCHSRQTAIERGWRVRASPDEDGWPTEPPLPRSEPGTSPSASRIRRALKAARDAKRTALGQGAAPDTAAREPEPADDLAALLLP